MNRGRPPSSRLPIEFAESDARAEKALKTSARDPALMKKIIEQRWAELRLIEFFRLAWPQFDPALLKLNWHHECVSEHLEAVSRGEIKRLLINVPPRATKTSLTSVCFPAWVWIQRNISFLSGPQVRFLCVSYGQTPIERMASTAKSILIGKWYQERWGDCVKITKDGLAMIENAAGGYRISDSLGGAILGSGGDIIIADDPISVEQAESDSERERSVRLFTEGLTTRRTVPEKTATIVVMQRLHENDISGHILEYQHDYQHIMLPMEFESRRFVFSNWYNDPRTEDGELLWPEQFPADTVEADKRRMGEYAAAGQYQQNPVPRGGGVIKRAWWRLWPDDAPEMAERSTLWWCPNRECQWTGQPSEMFGIGCPRCGRDTEQKVLYPPFSFQMLSVDTAYGEKEENSYSALTGWGIWHGKDDAPRVMMTMAWQGRPKLRTDPEKPEEMGLVERVHDSAQRRQVDVVLIEQKTRGVDLYNEINKLTSRWPFRLEYWNPTGRGDKVARQHACVSLFTNDLVWAPAKSWAEIVINQVTSGSRAKYNDLTDTTTMALLYLRHDKGLLTMADEHRREVIRERIAAGAKSFNASEVFEGV